MRIASVEVIPYALPFKEPYVTATGTLTRREMVLLRVRSEEGEIGLGEAVPLTLRGGASTEQVVEELRALDESGALAGAAAQDYVLEHFELPADAPPVSPPARCAALTALLDLGERLAARPRGSGRIAFSQVRHDPGPIPCNATLIAGDPGAVAEDALRWAEDGFSSFKLKVGTGDDLARVQAVREAVGPEAKIRLDANAAWSLDEAKRILAELEPLGIECVEQPVREIHDAVRLSWETCIPLAGDEGIVSKADAERAIVLGAYRLSGIKLSKVGGYGEGWNIAAILHSYVSSALDGPVGIAAGARLAQHIHFESINPYAPRFAHGLATQRLFASSVASVECRLEGDMLHLPEGPGLGVEIDEAALERHRL